VGKEGSGRKGFFGWLGDTLQYHSKWIIIGTLVITALLVLPMILMGPTENASENPSGSKVVELSDRAEDTFSSEAYGLNLIADALEGDTLTQECLYELLQNEQALRESDLALFLFTRYDPSVDRVINGVSSIADVIDQGLREHTGGMIDLSNATDDMVKKAVGEILGSPEGSDLKKWLSEKVEDGEDGWTSPGLMVFVSADDAKVTGEYPTSVGEEYAEEEAREQFARDVQEILRGEEDSYELWGIAIDLELEIEDEGKIAGVMLMAAMLLIAVLLLIIFRSWLITLVATLGLGMLIVWLKGFSNLVGLKSSMILNLIVPISILVLGIEYAIQSLFRYREEVDKGKHPPRALGDSMYAVSAALLLALLTTAVAFLSNASSNIESVRGFSIAASFAIVAAFLILGMFVPAVVMQAQARRERKRGKAKKDSKGKGRTRGAWLGSAVLAVSNKWFVVLPLVLVISGFALFGWLSVETRMDAEDALASSSDFVVSLDKAEEHFGTRGGEPAVIFIEGDLAQPEALQAIRKMIDNMDDNEHLGRGPDGKPNPNALLFDVLEAVVESEYVREQISAATGVEITDEDGDLVPDAREQLEAVYGYVIENGVPRNESELVYRPKYVEEAFIKYGPDEDKYATLVTVGVPGTREQEVVKASDAELHQDMEQAMESVQSIDFYGLTGSGYVRVDQFDAIARSMTMSLAIAAIAVFFLLILIFRSLRYAIIAMIPVLLVACWLYGFMYVSGYYLNMLTATIAAISIGVGIDFSIHFTERFREEMRENPDKKAAIRTTARTTGLGLLGTSVTTALGFMVIAFAPMPMFATFGVLTAVMIVFAFFMALFVLPSLLWLFAPNGKKASVRNA